MKLFRKLEDIFAATAFAEAGEYDTAREIAGVDGGSEAGTVCYGNDCLTQPTCKVA